MSGADPVTRREALRLLAVLGLLPLGFTDLAAAAAARGERGMRGSDPMTRRLN